MLRTQSASISRSSEARPLEWLLSSTRLQVRRGVRLCKRLPRPSPMCRPHRHRSRKEVQAVQDLAQERAAEEQAMAGQAAGAQAAAEKAAGEQATAELKTAELAVRAAGQAMRHSKTS